MSARWAGNLASGRVYSLKIKGRWYYLGDRTDPLDSVYALAHDLADGSGLIARGHQHALHARRKQSGACWTELSAHARCPLRTLARHCGVRVKKGSVTDVRFSDTPGGDSSPIWFARGSRFTLLSNLRAVCLPSSANVFRP